MRPVELVKPTVPISYVLLTLELAQERGVSAETLLAGLDIKPERLEQPDARIGLLLYGRLCIKAMQLMREPALGYEFGLRSNLTAHGFLGFGLMAQPTLRAAIEFGARYFGPLRAPGWETHLVIDGDEAVVYVHESVPYGILRQYALDMVMTALLSTFRPFLPPQPALQLRFDCAEPPHYARYRERLPQVAFDAGANQLRMPLEYLDLPIATANRNTAKLVSQVCERELALLGHTDDLLRQVRSVFLQAPGQYPGLPTMASRLHLAPRTLVRRLQQHGTSFQALLDEARYRDSVRLLEDQTLTLADIAARLGYSTPANFSRAFRSWTRMTPGEFRGRVRGS